MRAGAISFQTAQAICRVVNRCIDTYYHDEFIEQLRIEFPDFGWSHKSDAEDEDFIRVGLIP